MLRHGAIISRALAVWGLVASVAGCVHQRNIVAASVEDVGTGIATKNRYRLVWKGDNLEYDSNDGLNRRLQTAFPKVFSADGIPFMLEHSFSSYEKSYGWTMALFVVSCYTLPVCNTMEIRRECAVKIADAPESSLKFAHIHRKDSAFSLLTPSAMMFYTGKPCSLGDDGEFEQRRWFSSRKITFGTDSSAPNGDNTEDPLFDDAVVYGIAETLKRMEDEGIVNESVVATSARKRHDRMAAIRAIRDIDRKNREAKARQEVVGQTLQPSSSDTATKAPYHIVYLERESGSDFSYRFALELNGEPSVQTFFSIQNMFADEVMASYHLENANVDLHSLRIAVHPRLDNGRIEGRAEVLTLSPISLSYDANTRRGKLSVRFNAGQMEEARAWIGKNIETLARDKNIALVAGNPPPEATYYSLGEKIEGDVMEIEFKTE